MKYAIAIICGLAVYVIAMPFTLFKMVFWLNAIFDTKYHFTYLGYLIVSLFLLLVLVIHFGVTLCCSLYEVTKIDKKH